MLFALFINPPHPLFLNVVNILPFKFVTLSSLFYKMSQITIKSPKHCATKQVRIERNYKKIFFAFSTFFTTILLLILLIYFILKPSKPQFSLQELDIYQLNLSGPILNSSIQLTLLSKNPNQKVSIYYDEFQVYATYKNQQITSDSFVPPFYQGTQESNFLSSSLIGNGLPVAPSISYELSRDQVSGRLGLSLKANGKLRWKIGTWVSGRYRFNVNCDSIVAFGIGPTLNVPPLNSKLGALCSTTI